MKKVVFSLAVLCSLLMATTLSAQATRTWVSGVGDDVNPCSRTAPCKTWAGAISKTATCGEINALDPGGYGTLNITKSITINGAGTHASTLNQLVTGFIVNLSNAAEVCNTVVLRNISINGSATSAANFGVHGIRDISSVAHSLHIEHVDITHQLRGITINTTAAPSRIFMTDVDIRHTTTHGIDVTPTAGQLVKLSLHDVRSRQSNGDGLHLTNNAAGEVNVSQFEQNLSDGVEVVANTVFMNFIDTIMSSNNGNGLLNGSTALTHLDGCTLNSNGTGLLNNTGGTVNGFENNAIMNNAFSNVTGTGVVTVAHP
jgi:hypothetical protein